MLNQTSQHLSPQFKALKYLHVSFCPFMNVCMCVCLLTERYVGAYIPVQLCPVVVCELCAYESSPVPMPQ